MFSIGNFKNSMKTLISYKHLPVEKDDRRNVVSGDISVLQFSLSSSNMHVKKSDML